MEERTTTQVGTEPGQGSLESACAACGVAVRVDPDRREVEGPGSARAEITYADTDIVVWDCPGCRAANADALREP